MSTSIIIPENVTESIMTVAEASEAAHEFGALNTLLLVVILGLCILSAYIIKQNSFYYLPESAAAIVVGLFVGCVAQFVNPSAAELAFLTFEPQLFFFLLLPPIIFEAGYSLKKKDFFMNFWTISLFAVFGTIISTFIIGYIIYFIGLTGIFRIDTSSPIEALLFGSLISAVDPVATLSIMGNPELNCDPLLYSLVFGESVLNDAVSIILFKTFMTVYESDVAYSKTTIPTILMNFSIVSLGSVFVGVGIGLICCYLCKHTHIRKYPEYEIAILFLFAYGSFSFSESIQLSGIMSLFFCGIILSHYNSFNLSATSQITAHTIFKSLATVTEYFVFLYLGMGLFTGKFKRVNLLFFTICMIACLIARLFNIFPLSFIANLCRQKAIPLKMQGVIWFAGLRGAISFALSQNMPGTHRDLYISTTLSIVIFTTIVCGGLTEPMMDRMGMKNNLIQNSSGDSSDTLDEHSQASFHIKSMDSRHLNSRKRTGKRSASFTASTSWQQTNLQTNCDDGSINVIINNQSDKCTDINQVQYHLTNQLQTNSNVNVAALDSAKKSPKHFFFNNDPESGRENLQNILLSDATQEVTMKESEEFISDRFDSNTSTIKDFNRTPFQSNYLCTDSEADDHDQLNRASSAAGSIIYHIERNFMHPIFGGPPNEKVNGEFAEDKQITSSILKTSIQELASECTIIPAEGECSTPVLSELIESEINSETGSSFANGSSERSANHSYNNNINSIINNSVNVLSMSFGLGTKPTTNNSAAKVS